MDKSHFIPSLVVLSDGKCRRQTESSSRLCSIALLPLPPPHRLWNAFCSLSSVYGTRSVRCRLFMERVQFAVVCLWNAFCSLSSVDGTRSVRCRLFMERVQFAVVCLWNALTSLSSVHGTRSVRCRLFMERVLFAVGFVGVIEKERQWREVEAETGATRPTAAPVPMHCHISCLLLHVTLH